MIDKQKSPRLIKNKKSSSPNDYYNVVKAHQLFTEHHAPEFGFGSEKKQNMAIKQALKANVPAAYSYEIRKTLDKISSGPVARKRSWNVE